MDKRAVDMKRVIADATEQVKPMIESKRQRFDVHMSSAAAVVSGDHKRLVQVIANLLNNAAKYTPKRGRVSLQMMAIEDQVVLEISDTGIGISPEMLPHVFELFSQEERTRDRTQGGLGIGLALVKSLVELHEGSIVASSAGRNQGSTFVVKLKRLA